MVGRTAFALACILLGAVAAPNLAGAAPALPALTAGSDTVNVGDVFTIPISVSNVAGLTSFQFDLAFTPTIIKVVSFTDVGTDFDTAATAGGGSLTGITGFFDNAAGLLSGIADSISGLGTGLTPSGVIVDIEFQALMVGMSPLTLSNAFLTDNGVPLSSDSGDFMLQNGEVTVIGAVSVPEPGTLLLLSLPLAFVFCIHRGRRTMKKSTLVLALIGAITFASAPTSAQTTQNGPYYATPSWDQQLPSSTRWIVLANWNSEAVLDRETGLVWQASTASAFQVSLQEASFECTQSSAGGRGGWRLPNLPELTRTLVGGKAAASGEFPPLVQGSPFTFLQNGSRLWTSTANFNPDMFNYIVIINGLVFSGFVAPDTGTDASAWCVQSPNPGGAIQ
jgi:hypothetical protein